MIKKLQRVYKCQVGECHAAPSLDECYGVDVCDQCKLCTSDGRVVKTVKKDNIVYEVVHASGDEIILFSKKHRRLLSVGTYLDEFIENFQVVETGSYYY